MSSSRTSKSFKRTQTNDKRRLVARESRRSRSVDTKVAENNEDRESSSSGLANEYKPPLFRDKRVDEPLAKEWFNGLRSDLHQDQTGAFEYEYKSNMNQNLRRADRGEAPPRRTKQYYKEKEQSKDFVKETNAQWMNSLRPDEEDTMNFDFSQNDTELRSPRKSKISVKEMIRVKEDKKKTEKQMTEQWLNSLRSDVNENPHTWVALPSIGGANKTKVGKTRSNFS